MAAHIQKDHQRFPNSNQLHYMHNALNSNFNHIPRNISVQLICSDYL